MSDLRVALGIGSDIPAQAVVLVAGTFIGLGRIGRIAADLRLVGFGQRVGVDDLLAVPLAATELQTHPFGEIAGAGRDSAGGRFGVSLAHETVDRLTVDEDV